MSFTRNNFPLNGGPTGAGRQATNTETRAQKRQGHQLKGLHTHNNIRAHFPTPFSQPPDTSFITGPYMGAASLPMAQGSRLPASMIATQSLALDYVPEPPQCHQYGQSTNLGFELAANHQQINTSQPSVEQSNFNYNFDNGHYNTSNQHGFPFQQCGALNFSQQPMGFTGMGVSANFSNVDQQSFNPPGYSQVNGLGNLSCVQSGIWPAETTQNITGNQRPVSSPVLPNRRKAATERSKHVVRSPVIVVRDLSDDEHENGTTLSINQALRSSPSVPAPGQAEPVNQLESFVFAPLDIDDEEEEAASASTSRTKQPVHHQQSCKKQGRKRKVAELPEPGQREQSKKTPTPKKAKKTKEATATHQAVVVEQSGRAGKPCVPKSCNACRIAHKVCKKVNGPDSPCTRCIENGLTSQCQTGSDGRTKEALSQKVDDTYWKYKALITEFVNVVTLSSPNNQHTPEGQCVRDALTFNRTPFRAIESFYQQVDNADSILNKDLAIMLLDRKFVGAVEKVTELRAKMQSIEDIGKYILARIGAEFSQARRFADRTEWTKDPAHRDDFHVKVASNLVRFLQGRRAPYDDIKGMSQREIDDQLKFWFPPDKNGAPVLTPFLNLQPVPSPSQQLQQPSETEEDCVVVLHATPMEPIIIDDDDDDNNNNYGSEDAEGDLDMPDANGQPTTLSQPVHPGVQQLIPCGPNGQEEIVDTASAEAELTAPVASTEEALIPVPAVRAFHVTIDEQYIARRASVSSMPDFDAMFGTDPPQQDSQTDQAPPQAEDDLEAELISLYLATEMPTEDTCAPEQTSAQEAGHEQQSEEQGLLSPDEMESLFGDDDGTPEQQQEQQHHHSSEDLESLFGDSGQAVDEPREGTGCTTPLKKSRTSSDTEKAKAGESHNVAIATAEPHHSQVVDSVLHEQEDGQSEDMEENEDEEEDENDEDNDKGQELDLMKAKQDLERRLETSMQPLMRMRLQSNIEALQERIEGLRRDRGEMDKAD